MATKPKLGGAAAVDSFREVDLGDQRLNARLLSIARKLADAPDQSFPKVFGDTAELEAFYRFVRNPRVALDALAAGHFEETRRRASKARTALAVHDSTELSFGDARVRRRPGLGRIKRSDQGMLFHVTLAVDAEAGTPLGVLDAHVWTRPDATRDERMAGLSAKQQRELPSEGDRWLAQAMRVQDDSPAVDFIHVMDSEADDYALLAYMSAMEARYCIRVAKNRKLGKSDSAAYLGEHFSQLDIACTRTILLSPRGRMPGGGRTRHAVREGRQAMVAIGAVQVFFKRPPLVPDSVPLPPELSVNIVRVWELDVPEGEVPVEWVIATSEPINDVQQLAAIVDTYRQRWLIEEYFKALKTGCAYEARQLDSGKTLEAALGLFIPIASNLLALRTLARISPAVPASSVLSKAELRVLKVEGGKRFPSKPTVADALNAIAYMGGHIKNNGQPGWQVLARGYKDLAKLAAFAQRAGEM